MKRYILFGSLTGLVALLAVMSSLLTPNLAAQARPTEPPATENVPRDASGAPTKRPKNPTPADIEAYKQRVKTEDLKWERKLYMEARKKGMKFTHDGTPYPVPTDTYLMGDWAHKRKPGEQGLKDLSNDKNVPDLPDDLKQNH